VPLDDNSTGLNPTQRQRLLITCKHIDKLLEDIENTLHAASSKCVFPNYVNDLTPLQRGAIEDYVARFRGQLLKVLGTQALSPEQPCISASHAIHVGLPSSRLPSRSLHLITCEVMARYRSGAPLT
jgi:hypothetical protein